MVQDGPGAETLECLELGRVCLYCTKSPFKTSKYCELHEKLVRASDTLEGDPSPAGEDQASQGSPMLALNLNKSNEGQASDL